MALDFTAAQSILKRYFANKAVQNSIAKKQSAIYKRMVKRTDLGGDKFSGTQLLRDIFTVSPTFSVAQGLAANNATTPGLKFELTPVDLYAPVRVANKAEALSRTDKGAWIKAVGLAAASGMRMFHHVASIFALGTGYGEMSEAAITYTSGASFTANNGGVAHFVEGMPLVAANSIHGDTLRSATAANVSAVDYATGLVTTDVADLAGTLGWQTGDWVFLAGARQNSATPSRLAVVGLRTWLPEVRPVTDAAILTVEGTARSGNSRAFGNQVTQTGTQLDAIQDCVTACVVQGNAEDLTCYVSSARYRDIAKELRSDQRFTNTTNGTAGFLKLAVAASELTVGIEVDRNLEDDVGYALPNGAYEMVSAGEYPYVADVNGQWITVSDGDTREMRLQGYGVAFLNDPAACGVISFTALT